MMRKRRALGTAEDLSPPTGHLQPPPCTPVPCIAVECKTPSVARLGLYIAGVGLAVNVLRALLRR